MVLSDISREVECCSFLHIIPSKIFRSCASTLLFDVPAKKYFQIRWLALNGLWYIGIVISLYFIFNGTRLGAMIGAINYLDHSNFLLTDNTILG